MHGRKRYSLSLARLNVPREPQFHNGVCTFLTGKDAPLTPTDNSRPIGAAPETFNSEQDDEAAQAQTVSDDAIGGIADRASAHESRHGGPSNPAQIDPDDAKDVFDHMNQMERSGRIDMDAYRGGRNDDDEPETLGEAAREPDDVDSRGNRSRNNY